MEAQLCEQWGHPSLYVERMGGPWKHIDRRRAFIFYDNDSLLTLDLKPVRGLHAYTCESVKGWLYLDLSSITRSGPESQRGVSFQQLKESLEKPFLNRVSKCLMQTREIQGRGRAFTAHLFQKVPGFLCEVRWKAEFALQDFVNGLLSVFTSERRLW